MLREQGLANKSPGLYPADNPQSRCLYYCSESDNGAVANVVPTARPNAEWYLGRERKDCKAEHARLQKRRASRHLP